jgi:hypothetical protein
MTTSILAAIPATRKEVPREDHHGALPVIVFAFNERLSVCFDTHASAPTLT